MPASSLSNLAWRDVRMSHSPVGQFAGTQATNGAEVSRHLGATVVNRKI
jgi:hypothetical protein